MHTTLSRYVQLHFYCGLYIDPTLPYILVKKQQLQLLFTMLLSDMSQQQICHSNASYANYFRYRYKTNVSVYIPHITLPQSNTSPEVLVYIHFLLLAYAPEQIQYSCHITETVPTALIM